MSVNLIYSYNIIYSLIFPDINIPALVVTRPNSQIDAVLFNVLEGEYSQAARPPVLGHGPGAAPRRDHRPDTVPAASRYQATHQQRHFHRNMAECCNSEDKIALNREHGNIVGTEQQYRSH